MNAKRKLSFIVALVSAFTCVVWAGDPTAFELAKMGNQYVGVQSKDQIVQIRSEKSVASLTPNIWYVVYYDPDATLKAVEVKFGAGQKIDVSHPLRLLEPVTGNDRTLDNAKLKVDSDQALKIATSQPLLHNLTLKASKLTLGHGDEGPVWTVQLWAAKLKDPNDDADIGVVILSATDSSVVKIDLHPNSVD
jgi:hypothetical protein